MFSLRIIASSFIVSLVGIGVGTISPAVPDAISITLLQPPRSTSIQDTTAVLYSPRPVDFRPGYDEDGENRKQQSWEEYWRWIQTFYSGNILARGWTRECEVILKKMEAPGRRLPLINLMNRLGRLVAAEWAKDNAVRRIDSADIREWRSWLRKVSGRRPITEIQPIIDVLNRIELEAIGRLRADLQISP